MCGIIALQRRRPTRNAPAPHEVLAYIDAAEAALADLRAGELEASLDRTTEPLVAADRLLRGTPGVLALLGDPGLLASLETRLAPFDSALRSIERDLDSGAPGTEPALLERQSAALIRLKDAVWAISRDRIRTTAAVAELLEGAPSVSSVDGYLCIQDALSAVDRLEVRGRDSAGLHVLVRNHGLDLHDAGIAALLDERVGDPLYGTGAVDVEAGCLSFVYKAAAEIGELGDNTKGMRAAIQDDDLLRRALAGEESQVTVLGHTRWASVGIISIANAHPLNSDEVGRVSGPYVNAVLNGDVDNFADLKATNELRIRAEITTDAKVIPTLTSRLIASGQDSTEAFRRTVASLEGSVAIGASVATEPDRLFLALRGSGQALYIGCAEDAYIIASEPYGVVELADSYLRMDGETPADPSNPTASRGQVIVLDGARSGSVEGITRLSYDGAPLPVSAEELVSPEVTTRDIDRGDYPHYLLKEISEAPGSFRKTLRGKLVEDGDKLEVKLGTDTIPEGTRVALKNGSIRRVLVIGQGTAAVAGQSVAAAINRFAGRDGFQAEPRLATELSGFALRGDMSDTLVVAVSQSGTTTDTNRTVDLVRDRGAQVIAIVNRRNSDLTDKADGVLYTSDGRDVEMSVASTKAFYSQIAAGFLLACALGDLVGHALHDNGRQTLLESLRDLPSAMEETVARRETIGAAARQFAPNRRYWALVGNGVNQIAAQELRIKLSELCYKSIACDATEDKKHIDLSSEPMILVCAAGLSGSNADDVAKEVGIYRAHRAAPIVIVDEDESRFTAALAVLAVPRVHPDLGFVLSAMVGHLFGYEAALAIDAQAVPLREARAGVEKVLSEPATEYLDRLGPLLEGPVGRFFDGLRAGNYDGHLEASTAVRLASLLRYASCVIPLESYQVDYGKVGTPSVVLDDLTRALTQGIDQLTRPVDAIKHQAKTVTVGISRSDETLLQVPLVREVLAAGAARDRLSYESLRTLADLDPAVSLVTGYTRYQVERPGGPDGTIVVVDRGGIALDLPLRTETNPLLRGSKHRVANERRVLVNRGYDDRVTIMVPQVKDNQATGITLLHVTFHQELTASTIRSVLNGYRDRYSAIKDMVTETEPTFRDDLLADLDIADLLTAPIEVLAGHWRV